MKPICFTKEVSLPRKKGKHFSTSLLFALRPAFFFAFFFLLAAVVFASPLRNKTKDKKEGDNATSSLDWKADATVNNVSFYHAVAECGGKKVVFLKFVNKNAYAANITWKETVKTQMRPSENAIRGLQHLTLSPGETLAQDCNSTCKACVLTPEQVNPTYFAQIQDFSFTNITVAR